MQKIKKTHRIDPKKNASPRMDTQTDGQINRTDFIGPLPQR